MHQRLTHDRPEPTAACLRLLSAPGLDRLDTGPSSAWLQLPELQAPMVSSADQLLDDDNQERNDMIRTSITKTVSIQAPVEKVF